MTTVLFVHNNFPAQFRHLALELVRRGVRCGGIAQVHAIEDLPGVPMIRYALQRGTTSGIHPLAVRAEADFIRGAHVLMAAQRARSQGFIPDLIVGHTGWGETVLLKEVWPEAKQILYPEFFYASRGLDLGFDPEFKPYTEQARLQARSKNAVGALALTDADAIVCPTPFQASTFPQAFRRNIHIIHEGVDLQAIRPGPPEPFVLDDGRVIAPGAPVITHVNNNMEPMRGLHIFARALPRLLAEVPNAQVILIGSPKEQGYSGVAPEGRTWQEACFEGVEIDPARVHFLGRVPHERMLTALRLATAHVYYSYPFVLSWSLAEAMALGCYVIGSDTAPLHDAIEDGVNGRLLPFFDVAALSEAMIAACREPSASAPLRTAARATAERLFDRRASLAAWVDLIRTLGIAIPEAAAAV